MAMISAYEGTVIKLARFLMQPVAEVQDTNVVNFS